MCDCLQKIEAKILETVKENANGEVTGGKILQSHFPFSENGIQNRVTYNEFYYTLSPLKKDGTTGKPKRQTVDIGHAYCPFCGEKHS